LLADSHAGKHFDVISNPLPQSYIAAFEPVAFGHNVEHIQLPDLLHGLGGDDDPVELPDGDL
jgi:hypothetical protein